ncbi:MAG: hypothetical protein ABW049_14705 [Spongiibacteraceae bacterium]
MFKTAPTYSAKTRLGELCTPEIFVVMLIRLRVAAVIDPSSVPEDWRAGLRAAGVASEGADAFDLLMHLLGPIPRLSLDVRSLRCGGLGEGEALLLQTISLLQHDHYDEAETILGRWLPPGASRVAALQTQRFARALVATKLRVPLRQCETGSRDAYRPAATNRGLSLLH